MVYLPYLEDDARQFVRLLGQIAFADDPSARFEVSQAALLKLWAQWDARKDAEPLKQIEIALYRNLDLLPVLARVFVAAVSAGMRNRIVETPNIRVDEEGEDDEVLHDFLAAALERFGESLGRELIVAIGPDFNLKEQGYVSIAYGESGDLSRPKIEQRFFASELPCWAIALTVARLLVRFSEDEVARIRLEILQELPKAVIADRPV